LVASCNPLNILPSESLTISYVLKFHKEFIFGPIPSHSSLVCHGQSVGRGGKVPFGMAFGKGKAAGGEWSEHGGSCRIMFEHRENDSPRLGAYVYLPLNTFTGPRDSMNGHSAEYRSVTKASGTAGHMVWGKKGPIITPGKDHKITLHVKMNTPGLADGVLFLSVDDQEYVIKTMTWRKDSTTKIEAVWLQAFYGGSNNNWLPLVDTGNKTSFYMKDISISTQNPI
jgi:hypothetical protein